MNHTRGPVTLGELAPRPGTGHFRQGPLSPGHGAGGGPGGPRPAPGRAGPGPGSLAETSPFNRVTRAGPWGIVTSGVSRGLRGRRHPGAGPDGPGHPPGTGLHPSPAREAHGDFLAGLERVLVVEELEPLPGRGLKAVAQARGLTLPIRGKAPGLFSRLYEYHPGLVRQMIARILRGCRRGPGAHRRRSSSGAAPCRTAPPTSAPAAPTGPCTTR